MLRGYQQEGSSQTYIEQKDHGNDGKYKPTKKFEGNCYNCRKQGHMAKDCWFKKLSFS